MPADIPARLEVVPGERIFLTTMLRMEVQRDDLDLSRMRALVGLLKEHGHAQG